MTLVEAGFSGCPIISSNVGIAGDVLVSGKDALICSVGDKDCYLGAIIRLIEDNALRESLKREATKHLEDHVGTKHSFLIRYRKALEMCFPKAHFSE